MLAARHTLGRSTGTGLRSRTYSRATVTCAGAKTQSTSAGVKSLGSKYAEAMKLTLQLSSGGAAVVVVRRFYILGKERVH